MHRAAIVLSALSAFATFAYGEPGQVIVIRHGEKPDRGDGLSLKGLERAAALAPFFAQSDGTFGKPAAIFAQKPTQKRPSRRPVETVAPLAQALGLDVQKHHHSDFAAMAKQIVSNRKYDGKTVLICWEHHAIPEVAAALGVADPPPWRDQAFDRVWVITFKDGKAKLKDVPQRLLFGDSPD